MNARPAASGADQARRARLAKIHIAKAQLQLDDTTYRQLLARLFKGKTSAGDLSVSELDALLEHFKAEGFKDRPRQAPKRAGSRAMAHGPSQDKLRALWISLYHLGAVRDPSEAALAAYVKRTTRVEALQWLDVEAGTKAIEGLKKMAERHGVDWTKAGLGRWEPFLPARSREPFAVVSAQWRRLAELGALPGPSDRWWGAAIAATSKPSPDLYTPEDWHRVMEWFGRAIRQAQAGSTR